MARTTPSPTDSRRAEVERAYGGPIPDGTWDWLIRKRYVQEFEDSDLTAADLASTIRELNAVAPAAVTRTSRRVMPANGSEVLAGVNARLRALAEAIALRVTRNSRVEAWRAKHLPDGLISPSEITDWIEDTYRRELPDTWPRDRGPTDATNSMGDLMGWRRPYVRLEWVDKTASSLKIWGVPTRGTLARLAELAERLAKDWDWHLGFATNFVLTGATPPRPGVRGVSFRSRHGWDDRYGPYEFMWVRTSIDAEVTPEELAVWWRGVRAEVGASGRRPIGEKSAQLALFAMSRDENTTYRQDMEAWNSKSREDWRFEDWRNYRSAALRAVHALNCPAADLATP